MLAKAIMEKVTVIGAGLTGAVTAALLRKHLPESCAISLLDKSRGSGGRMSTSRGPDDCGCSVDLGAQYISASPDYYNKHKEFYSELLGEGLLKPMNGLIEGENPYSGEAQHFIAPAGIASVVKYFMKKSGATVEFNHQISSCENQDGRWKLTAADGTSSMTDGLVLTMPTPQILGLKGTVKSLIDDAPDIKKKLEAVSYSSRFALGLFYKPETQIDVPWCAKYIKDKVIRFVALDTKKRELDPSGGTSVVVHASVPFSLQHLEEDKDTVCSEKLLPRVRELVPELPPPDAVKNHKWRFSQVHKNYEGSPGAVLLHSDPPLILAGDAFAEACRFDGCIDSASTAIDLLRQASKL